MASQRAQIQEEKRFQILRLLNETPSMSSREIAKAVGISNGAAYYCVNALIAKGLIKLGNFRSSPQKEKYAYILTPQGLSEKARLTLKFLNVKKSEFERLKKEIEELDNEANFIATFDRSSH